LGIEIKNKQFYNFHAKFDFDHVLNEEPRGKPRGIFFGEVIYYTGGGHTQLQLL
jgi:hypothetical protein